MLSQPFNYANKFFVRQWNGLYIDDLPLGPWGRPLFHSSVNLQEAREIANGERSYILLGANTVISRL